MLQHKASQRDNERIPHSACSYTSMAMCLEYFGVIAEGGWEQLEDELSEFAEIKKGLERGSPHAMDFLIDVYFGPHAGKTPHGVENVYHEFGSIDLIKESVLKGHPCIIHGYFTLSGHVIVVIGYDDDAYNGRGALVVLDPYGECDLATQSYEGMPTTVGPHLYSYPAVERLCYVGDTFWVHVIRPKAQA
jgi:hypothetical protein